MENFETVVGLEVHIELATATKMFCSCPTDRSAEPNASVCPVCLGLPGALPVINAGAVELAIRAGAALGCEIHRRTKFDRKNFFYPDQPKAYQITQYDRPLCTGGSVEIATAGGEKSVGITRIHLEEDAGKLTHEGGETLVDFNRCGVPLIEIVSEPDMRSGEEAVAYLKKLRAIMRRAGVSECRLSEGEFRCDINLSVHRVGEPLGTRTEIKNLNSFQSVARAIDAEARRQTAAVERGERVEQLTMRFDAASGKTIPMRRKETDADYRFFPEPDLPELAVDRARIEAIKASIPELPDETRRRFMTEYGLKPYDAEMLARERATAEWFERAAALTKSVKTLANLTLTELFRLLESDEAEMKIAPPAAAKIADMAADGEITGAVAKQLLGEVWECGGDPEAIVRERGLGRIADAAELDALAAKALAENPKALADYRRGKTAARGALVGAMMRATGGRADPRLIAEALDRALSE